MRPLKIILSGFGPYCNKTEIDMSLLGKKGLYLITGNTGSGKTTIFDAITYALYNSPSGQHRKVEMLRCNFAGPEIPTFVDFTFEFRDKIYNVKRNPEYMAKGEKKDLVKKKSESILTLPDGKVILGDTAVTKYINTLLGINKEQFTQIAMISQGEFLKLLLANTKDRNEIFREIFKTHRYEQLMLNLKDENSKYKDLYSDLEKKLLQSFRDVYCDENDFLSYELENLKENPGHWEDKIQLLEKIIEKDNEKYLKIQEENQENDKSLKKITEELIKAADYKAIIKSLEEKSGDFENFKEKLSFLKGEWDEIKKKEGDIQRKRGQVTLLLNQLTDFDELERKEKEIDKAKKDLEEIQRKSIELSKKNEEDSLSLEEKKSLLKKLMDSGEKIQELKFKIEREFKINASLLEIKEMFKSYKELSDDLELAQKDFQRAYQDSQKAQTLYNQNNKAFLDDMAGILSEKLVENQACPVCGSKEHPKIAEKSLLAPSKEELEASKEKMEQAIENHNRLNEKAALLKGRCDSLKNSLEESLNKAECKEENLEEKILQSENLLNELRLEEEKLQQDIESKNQLEIEIPKIEKSLSDNIEIINQLKMQNAEKQVFISTEEKNLKELKEKLSYQSKVEAEKNLSQMQAEVDSYQEKSDKASKEYDACKERVNLLEGNIKSLTEQAASYKKVDVQDLEEKQLKLEDIKKELASELQVIFSRNQTNSNSLSKIKVDAENLLELEKKSILIDNLYKTASGNLSNGKFKIMLETYVQMSYFDRILAYANKRLMIMTSGQYELLRRQDEKNLKTQIGLDLDVMDHYNGGRRSVSSLSGGESFEASLALALGLSDEITHSAGGIKIDTMFVDEGFGTLDSDTIQKAYKALLSITEGNRLVGIISHVDYLKENIDKKIIISKDKILGSNVEIKL